MPFSASSRSSPSFSAFLSRLAAGDDAPVAKGQLHYDVGDYAVEYPDL